MGCMYGLGSIVKFVNKKRESRVKEFELPAARNMNKLPFLFFSVGAGVY